MAAIEPTVLNQNKSTEVDDIILAYVYPRVIGVRLDYKKPKSFDSAEECKRWEKKARKDAEFLKLRLELQLERLDCVGNRIIRDLSSCIKYRTAYLRCTKDREDELICEKQFVQLSMLLRNSLGLKKADTEGCLKIMKKIKDLPLTELMLLRNPDIVEAVRKMRRYIGNLKEWNLNNEEEAVFKVKAQQIRIESKEIYGKFKRTFKYVHNEPFCDKYENRLEKFELLTSSISRAQLKNLCQRDWANILTSFFDDDVDGKITGISGNNNIKTPANETTQTIHQPPEDTAVESAN